MAAALTQASARAGESLRETKPIAQLMADLESGDAAIRAGAASELATRGEEARPTIGTLARLLKDPAGNVRVAAAETLGTLALEPDVAIPALVDALTDETFTDKGPIYLVAGLALGDFHKPAVPHLLKTLTSDRLCVQRGGLAGVYRAGAAANEAVPQVIAILERDESDTRIFALNACIGIGPGAKDAIPVIVKRLSSDDFHTQYWACRALGAIGPEAAVAAPDLIRQLDGTHTSVRRNAAKALGQIGPAAGQPAVDALTKALSDFSQIVRQDAVVALGKLKPLSAPVAPVIEELLQHPTHFVPRVHAAKTLWLLKPESEAPIAALLRDLEHDDEPWEAARVLGEIDVDAATIDRLIELLKSRTVGTREYAAVALGEIGPEAQRAAKDVEALLQDAVEDVREDAAAVLKKLRIEN
jgi:HEAT repeat protein